MEAGEKMSFSSFLIRLVVLSTLVMLPLWYALATAWPVNHDPLFYSNNLKLFSSQFWAGDLYPRWLMGANGGLGAPIFLFYGPLPYYAASLFSWLAPFDPNGFGRLLLTIQLAFIVAGLSAYLWLKDTFSRQAALHGALFYAFFPFCAFVLYLTFGMSTLWSIACLPLLLWAARETGAKGWVAIPKLSAAYALFALIHLPPLLIFSPVAFCYAVFSSARGARLQTVVYAAIASFLGAGLVAVYLWPLLANQPFILSGNMLHGGTHYAKNFLDETILCGFGVVGGLFIAAYLETPLHLRRSRWPEESRFWACVMLGAIFMMTPLSRPVWEAIPALHYLQFPGRFLIAMIPAVVWVYMRWLPYLRTRYLHHAIGVLVYAGFAFFSAQSFFFPSKAPIQEIVDYSPNISNEYATAWMRQANPEHKWYLPRDYHDIKAPAFAKGRGVISEFLETPRRIALRTEVVSSEATILLKRFYFPGWQAEPSAAEIKPERGLLAVTLPKGKHDVILTMPYFAGEREGMQLSAAALVIWMAMAVYALRARRNQLIK